ncbi:SDR family oxidoreductase [Thermocrinis minervae]|uniref:NADH dehydrogenase n=1 Tax=Thermocrinis minervae TaxID=381751 RepID=A0A1M6QWB8_9AQUI|nr:NAD-dependent epimerase/dehydratase family protein [Thermocrinis minervae]SHK24367.1 NADH dehydrogenase [Thermocrinis minervae]
MKVIVTGATGFVGRYIVRKLLEDSHEVALLVRNKEKAQRIFGERVKVYQVNFESRESLRQAFESFRPEGVVHLIGILTESRRKGITFKKVHYLYSKLLYEVCREFQVKRVVHMSSLGTHPRAPSDYHQTKYMAEQELINSGISYAIMRPSIILGPEQKLFSQMWVITKYIRLLAIPKPDLLFQPVDVRDVACAFSEALKDPQTGMYELCGTKRVRFRDLLEDIFNFWRRKVLILPIPKSFAFVGGLLAERIMDEPLISSDQVLMMWRDNVCGLDEGVVSEGVKALCGRDPIPYEESLMWSLEEFEKSIR